MDAFAALVFVLTSGDTGDWSLPAVAALVASPAGCEVATTPTGRVEVTGGPPGVRIDVVRDPDVDDPAAPGGVYGLGLTLVDGDLRAAVGAAQRILGPPPTLGGPGPWVRWPTGSTWWTLTRAAGTGTVRLFAEPAARAAQDERRDVESGTLRSLPYLWRVDDAPRLPPGSWLPPARPTRTVTALAAQLDAVCVALVEAGRELPDHVPGLTLTVHTRKGHEQVTLISGPDALTVGSATTQEFRTDTAGARGAAAALYSAVASWAVRRPDKDLRLTARTTGGQHLSLPALGIAVDH